jgi:uncharacterized protein YegL
MSAYATLLPFYMLCDVSASMSEDDRIVALQEAVVATCDAAAMHPVVADRIRFGILTFASRAEVTLPLCDVGMIDEIPRIDARDLTSYGEAFALARSTIELDVAQFVADGFRVFRPTIFFLTDGRPTDQASTWRPALSRLLDPNFPHHPNIVAFGVGEAERSVLKEVGTVAAYVSSDEASAPAAIAAFGALLVGSVVASGTAGTFRLPDDTPLGLEPIGDYV